MAKENRTKKMLEHRQREPKVLPNVAPDKASSPEVAAEAVARAKEAIAVAKPTAEPTDDPATGDDQVIDDNEMDYDEIDVLNQRVAAIEQYINTKLNPFLNDLLQRVGSLQSKQEKFDNELTNVTGGFVRHANDDDTAHRELAVIIQSLAQSLPGTIQTMIDKSFEEPEEEPATKEQK